MHNYSIMNNKLFVNYLAAMCRFSGVFLFKRRKTVNNS